MIQLRTLCLVPAVTCVAVAAAGQNDAPRFQSVYIPALQFDESTMCCETAVAGMAPDGSVLGTVGAGVTSVGRRGFRWNETDGMVDLTGSQFTLANAQFMNDAGWIAGEAANCPKSDGECPRALFLVDPAGTVYDLGDPDGNALAVVGLTPENQMLYQGQNNAFFLGADGQQVELAMPSGGILARARGLSANGTIVGGSAYIDGSKLPVQWLDGGQTPRVLEVPGKGVFDGNVFVGPDGSILGNVSEGTEDSRHAVRWNNYGVHEILPEPTSASNSNAVWMDSSVIVGFFEMDAAYYAVVWSLEDGEVVNVMHKELPPNTELFSTDILRTGQHVAISLIDMTNYEVQLMLLPISGGSFVNLEDAVVLGELQVDSTAEPSIVKAVGNSSASLFAVDVGFWQTESFLMKPLRDGDVNGDDNIDGADLTKLLGAWGSGDRACDINGDGLVDGADLTLVLSNWGT